MNERYREIRNEKGMGGTAKERPPMKEVKIRVEWPKYGECGTRHDQCSCQALPLSTEIEADLLEGAPDNIVRIVTENCKTLKFKQLYLVRQEEGMGG